MREIYTICAILLLIGIIDLPIRYYTFLRIVVTIVAVTIILKESQNKNNFWMLLFIAIAIVFNPLIPVYLYNKAIWIPIDIVTVASFLTYGFINKKNT
ncbi:DUF6804 family protein [Flavobacterium sp.]|uniref:DUF6804 family protein n=1 Tax=Flavobacterium sp. TaxID=239 RepID=UPI003D6B2659